MWSTADGSRVLWSQRTPTLILTVTIFKMWFLFQFQDAIKSSKNAPPQSGILVKPGSSVKPAIAVEEVAVTPAPNFSSYLPPTSTPAPASYLPPSTTYAPPTSTYLPPSTPDVYVSHNSIESSTEKPRFDFRPTVAPIAANSISQSPFTSYSSTPSPFYSTSEESPSSTPAPIYISSTPAPVVAITSNILREFNRKYSTPKPDIQQYYDNRDYSTNSLNLDPYSADNAPVDRVDQYRFNKYQSVSPNRYQTSVNPANYYGNYLGNGYNPQYPQYDGVSVTNNGFRYYLPRQYHEEENSGSDTRTGSFGYVDPFGIRRVIYYNTSPGSGFVHRKNNRYVGLNATPYDPRPL